MVSSAVFIEPHGSRLHSHAILELKLICIEKGYIELDPTALRDKGLYPGIPDAVFLIQTSRTNSKGKRTDTEIRRIFELETDATKASIAKKCAQYDTSLKGYELNIVNLRHMRDKDSLSALREYLGERIP